MVQNYIIIINNLYNINKNRNVEVISVQDGTRVFVEEATSGGQKNPSVLIGNSMLAPKHPVNNSQK